MHIEDVIKDIIKKRKEELQPQEACRAKHEVELLCNKSARNVLAIDISLNSSGVCFWNAGAPAPECIDKIENPVGGDMAPKLQHIYDRVIRYLDIPGVTAVALEDIFVGANPKTTITLAKVHGAILLAAAQKSVRVTYLSSTAIKKALGCKKKKEVFDKVCTMLPETTKGFTFSKNNDVTDACAIAYASMKLKA